MSRIEPSPLRALPVLAAFANRPAPWKRSIRCLLALALIQSWIGPRWPLTAPAAAQGSVYYVSLQGSDSNDGSAARPWRNLDHAVEQAGKPGNTIYLRGGRYAYSSQLEVWINQDRGLGGANGQFLTLAGHLGEQVTLANVRIIVDAPWVRIQGLRFENIGVGVVSWAGRSSHVEILDNTFEGPDFSYGAITLNADDSLVAGNTIRITGRSGLGAQSHGIYVMWGKNNVIRGNWISGATGYGIHVYDEDKYPGYQPIFRDIILEGNTVTQSRERSGIIVSGAQGVTIERVLIRNNVISANNHVAISIGSYGAVVQDIDILNNTFYQNGVQTGVAIDESGGSVGGVRIQNNIFDDSPNANCTSNCSWYSPAHISAAPEVASVEVGNNLYLPQSVPLDGVADAAAMFGEPLFVAPAAGDFHLQAASPAVDAGIALIGVTADKDGLPRPQGARYDLGAYERPAADPAPTFVDVPASHWAYADIEKLYQAGYVVGCQATPERKYCPEGTLSRAEAAVFVVRGAGFTPPQPTQSAFADVPLGHWGVEWIEQLWQDGFSAGCASDPLRFCPDVPHTRAEATVFFVRMLRGKDYVPGEPASLPYTDVARGAWYFKWVAAAYEAGLVQDCEAPEQRGDDRFRPEAPITRAEGGCMMVRAKGLSR